MTRGMKINRRAALKVGGTGAVLAAAGGVWRAWEQGVWSAGEGPAYEPWRRWRSDPSEGPLALVRAAILAANPHNSQPWLFRVGASRIDLFADPARDIGAVDPDHREMYIGLGCALENLLLAAGARGLAWRLALMPDRAHATHVARIDLTPGPRATSELYEAIPHRHTNRGPYDRSRAVPPDLLDAMTRTAGDDARLSWLVSDTDRRRLGQLIVRATEAIVADDAQSRASARWFRFRWADVQRHRDGITIDANLTDPLMRVAAKMLPPLSRERSDRFWLAATRDTFVATAAGFGILSVHDARDNAQRLRGGRAWQRLHLQATARGLALQPLNQPTERADRERVLAIEPTFGRALTELVDDAAWQALMTFRVGYPTRPAALSPRRAAEALLI
ncbi:MAG: hypothetical protein AUH77_03275 [Candidatus Rokubacteria bacterium 13_1_40CM_4_69_39]|nr:MAG: hypothetical protein AUH77_03275 [Candidatus Rokubacteria bacterium 13_1_40CM_4_69_39]OLD77466.1 MAG: hypothetical protein AUG87_04580 [Candidatus Rokubacteria bacterium 13_1_20CM_4_70_14]OLE46323.1 MAG: hypothetical protein AUG01_12410 [Candidatus Rokubacteria bacterium 13_1_20CM_2_69_58]